MSKEPITLHDLTRLQRYCLNIMSLMDRLAGGAPEEKLENGKTQSDLQHAAVVAHGLLESLRKVNIAALMYERTLICVSGMQGAGKTTLMKHFYGLDDEYLNISLDRGEQIPIFITESRKMEPGDAPRLYAVQIAKNNDGDYDQMEKEMDPKEFREASKGADITTLYLELRVPCRYTFNEKESFVLLPGFEAQKSYRETLIDFAVSSSDAAIFAFDGRLLSQQDNYKHLKELAEKFGAHIIYAITRSDSSSDDNASVRDTFVKEMHLENEEQVVCTGTYVEEEKNKAWIDQLKKAVGQYVSPNMRSQARNIEYLKDEINRILARLGEIDNTLDAADEGDMVSHTNDKILREFDRALEKQVEIYRKNLAECYSGGLEESRAILSKAMDEQNGVKNVLRRNIFGTNKKDMEAAERLVSDSLYGMDYGDHAYQVPEKIAPLAEIGPKDVLSEGFIHKEFIPDRCRRKALEASLHTLEDPEKTSLRHLLTTGKKDGKKYLKPGKQNQDVPKMIYGMLQRPDVSNDPVDLPKNVPTQCVMSAMVEMATYYYSVANYDELAKADHVEGYKPCDGKISMEAVKASAREAGDFVLDAASRAAKFRGAVQPDDAGATGNTEDTPDDESAPKSEPAGDAEGGFDEAALEQGQKLYNKFKESSAVRKFSMGMFSMMGLDLLGDAQINMIPQIAASFGVGVEVVAGAATAAIGAAAAAAVSRDIARIQCDDYRRAQVALETAYDDLQEKALQDYKDRMKGLRDRLEQNICAMDPRSMRTQQIYNTKRQIGAAQNLLFELSERCMEKRGESFI